MKAFEVETYFYGILSDFQFPNRIIRIIITKTNKIKVIITFIYLMERGDVCIFSLYCLFCFCCIFGLFCFRIKRKYNENRMLSHYLGSGFVLYILCRPIFYGYFRCKFMTNIFIANINGFVYS